MRTPPHTLKIGQNLLDLSTPKVMGILNLTPDSFFDGGKYTQETIILTQVEKMLQEGATFIDLGGYSTRPGAEHISQAEEYQRVIPIITLILKHFPSALISIDTFRAEIARAAVGQGAIMVNDISGGELDEAMFETVAQLKVPYILMHSRGTPQTMTQLTVYDDLVKDICLYFNKKVRQLQALGQYEILLDVGFGFAKNITQNFHLLHHLSVFKNLGLPLLAGLSRKSMIYKTLSTNAQEALNGTSVLNTIALLGGASVLRIHDVKEAAEAVKLLETLKKAEKI